MNQLALLLGGSWGAGINLYLTVAGLGLAHRFDLILLPGKMEVIANPLVIGVAILIYAVEFFADKVPLVDSTWDSFHTFIRPAGAIILGYLALSDANPAWQVVISLLCGTVALDSHLTKATARAAINTSPEPLTNSVASVTEDVSVLGALYLIIHHPAIITIGVIGFIIFSIWFLRKMFVFLKKVVSRKPNESEVLQ